MLCFAGGAAVAVAGGKEERRLDGSYLNDFRLSRITPHVEFARPAAWKSPRVLFVVPQYIAAREVGELAQRLDMQYEVVTVAHETAFGGTRYAAAMAGTRAEEKEAEMLAALKKPHDVIVLGNFQYTAFPESIQAEIERQVREGVGLLFVFRRELPEAIRQELEETPETSDRDWIWRNVPLADLPHFPGRWSTPPKQDQLATCRLGKGRVALLDYKKPRREGLFSARHGGPSLTPNVPFHYELPTLYRALLSLPAHALLWCANRVPPARLTLSSPVIAKESSPVLVVAVEAGEGFSGAVSVLVRDRYGRFPIRQVKNVEFSAGHNEVSFQLPRLHHGRFIADVWLRQEGKTMDWGSVSLRVGTPVLSYELMKTAWTEQKRVLETGDRVSQSFEIARPLTENQVLELWLKDAGDRILQRVPATVAGQTVQLDFQVRATTSFVLRPEWVVRSDQEIVDSFQIGGWFYSVRQKQERKFHFVLWGQHDPGMLGYWAYDAFRAVGMDTLLYTPRNGHFHRPLLKALGLLHVPYIYRMRVAPSKNDRYEFQFPFEAWLQPEDQQKFTGMCRGVAKGSYERGSTVLSYTLGDEPFLGARNVGFREWWMPAFQTYLREQYGSVEALNRSWLTDYESFDQVLPKKSSEVKTQKQFIEKVEVGDRCWKRPPETRVRAHTYAPYVDHRRFVTRTFPKMIATLQQEMRTVDPGARLGFEGAGNIEPYYGTDLPELSRVMGKFVPYWNRASHEVVRSCRNKSLIQGTWFGGYIGGRRAHTGRGNSSMWDSVFSGANSLWFFCTGGALGGLNLDLSLAPYVATEDLHKLGVDGLGEWLASAAIVEDPIAIHYSVASNDVLQFEYPWGYSGNVHQSWIYLLHDLGYTPHYLDQIDLENDALDPSRYRVFILPNSVALSAREAAAIRRFAQRGGTVIADLRPGVLSHHGLYLDEGQLDPLFGVQRSTTRRQTKIQPVSGQVEARNVFLSLSATDTDSAVRAAGGRGTLLADGTPVVIEKRAGKGLAVLLNFNVYPYFPGNLDSRLAKDARPKTAAGLGDLVRRYCRRAGVKVRWPLLTADGGPAAGTRRTRFRGQDALLVGVLGTPYGVSTDALGHTVVESLREGESADDELTVRLERNYWVYDVMQSRPLGRRKEVAATVRPDTPLLLALFTHEVEAPAVTLSADTVTAGAEVAVDVLMPKQDKALVLIEVYDPNGTRCRWVRRLVWTAKGLAQTKLPIAWNETPGVYKVVATHVVTGRRGKAHLTVGQADPILPARTTVAEALLRSPVRSGGQ